jgi:hypothetical protein
MMPHCGCTRASSSAPGAVIVSDLGVSQEGLTADMAERATHQIKAIPAVIDPNSQKRAAPSVVRTGGCHGAGNDDDDSG